MRASRQSARDARWARQLAPQRPPSVAAQHEARWPVRAEPNIFDALHRDNGGVYQAARDDEEVVHRAVARRYRGRGSYYGIERAPEDTRLSERLRSQVPVTSNDSRPSQRAHRRSELLQQRDVAVAQTFTIEHIDGYKVHSAT